MEIDLQGPYIYIYSEGSRDLPHICRRRVYDLQLIKHLMMYIIVIIEIYVIISMLYVIFTHYHCFNCLLSYTLRALGM